ncbi:cupin [Marinobacterium zhoushanense]|uniref:Cupin n=1 Tax=Marinobacterium zhoushanense TaxID=1679163 RepID=A0ABQ1KC84_9GAMM|nr:cupin domain-containing protein [Marinobacterium zhoushanense]GGB90761.1 cupin [Marinobacterium zhoushanense]
MNKQVPLGELTPEQFLRDYWQKKPLLIRDALPDFEPLLSADELAGLACEQDVESRLIRFDAKGDSWTLSKGPFDETHFSSLPSTSWTLLVQAVDHWVPEAAELMDRFNFIPNWRVDDLMISYAVDGGGVGPHYDNYDVFLLQAEGTRRWELGGICDEHSPRREDAPVMILPEWEVKQSFELNPGDMLYLPPQVAHNGVAVGDGCVTYSIGFRAPAHNEILRSFSDFIGEQLGREQRYSDADLTLQANPGEISAAALDRVADILRGYLGNRDQLESWFGQYMTEPKYPELAEEGELLEESEIAGALAEGYSIRRAEGSRLAFVDHDDETVLLFADSQQHLAQSGAATLARQLCRERELDVGQLSPLTPDALSLLKKLLQQGCCYLTEG